ncbi:hypothetical protein [Luteolibacter sp. Populi]|uniref:hypothetical protein n=1 Tax=Luteolibacter sp. Populi TaxID=3230487 RepID=UPI0034665380
MSVDELQALLEYYVPPDRAHWMAQSISEDMATIGFPIKESSFTSSEMWRAKGAQPQAEYWLPKNQFDINSAIGSQAFAGSFFTTGNLLRLGQCVLLGRKFLPDLWPGDFGALLRGAKHLDALNEIWWLKFVRSIQTVTRGPKEAESDPDYDWQIKVHDGLAPLVVNLEVKRRTSNINKFFKEGRPNASLGNISKKFKSVDEGTANIAALTIYHPVSTEIDRNLRNWLEDQEHLHGLLVWTEGSRDTLPMKKFFKKSHWAEFLIGDHESEDLMIAGQSMGTLCEVEDAPAFLEKLVDKIRNEQP